MNPPPAWPFDTQTDALDALNNGTFWARTRRWADHMDTFMHTPHPPMGARHHPHFAQHLAAAHTAIDALAHTRTAPRKAA